MADEHAAEGRAASGHEQEAAHVRGDQLGGDPACWLNRVCDSCGRFVEDQFADACPRCGASLYEQGGV